MIFDMVSERCKFVGVVSIVGEKGQGGLDLHVGKAMVGNFHLLLCV